MTNVVQQLYAVGIDENPAFNKKKIINPMIKEHNYVCDMKKMLDQKYTKVLTS